MIIDAPIAAAADAVGATAGLGTGAGAGVVAASLGGLIGCGSGLIGSLLGDGTSSRLFHMMAFLLGIFMKVDSLHGADQIRTRAAKAYLTTRALNADVRITTLRA